MGLWKGTLKHDSQEFSFNGLHGNRESVSWTLRLLTNMRAWPPLAPYLWLYPCVSENCICAKVIVGKYWIATRVCSPWKTKKASLCLPCVLCSKSLPFFHSLFLSPSASLYMLCYHLVVSSFPIAHNSWQTDAPFSCTYCLVPFSPDLFSLAETLWWCLVAPGLLVLLVPEGSTCFLSTCIALKSCRSS